MEGKAVSIIIPAYNEEKLLPACLESLSNLNYPKDKFEVIVVDNGSTDKTREIARKYGALVFRDDSKNVSGLRNLGAKQARGDILAFVDADCLVSSEWLNKATVYFDDPSVAAWGGVPIPPKDSTWVQRAWSLVLQKKHQVQEVGWLPSMNLFVRKEQFGSIGGFNESLITCEDVDFSYKIGLYGKIIADSEIEMVHLGEAATLKEFMKKEMWRGHSNLKGILSHGLLLRELPSLSLPLYFGVLLPAFWLGFIISLNHYWFIASILSLILPTLAVLVKLRGKKITISDLLRVIFLIQLYFFSRTVAIVKRQ
ncbi:MAG: glycosyltransferase [Nitrospirota bacterium]